MSRDVTLLWALRSPCAFACPHCYFGTIEEHATQPPTQAGVLSHLSRTDLPLATLTAFARTLAGSDVERVVIAGGEPLDWPGTLEVIAAVKKAGCEVAIATNGVPLTRPHVTERLVDLGVDSVSVSLDHADPEINDRMRPSRSGRFGYHDVLAGIRALRQARGPRPAPGIGIYTVITREHPQAITEMAALAAESDVDYYVPQPISLPANHALAERLCHTPADATAVRSHLDRLYREPRGLTLPDSSYVQRFIASISTQDSGQIPECFGGARLFFIQPDGSLWDCPSDRRIAATPPARRRTIRGADARGLFADRPSCTDCTLFSRDCVNMWPLMDMSRQRAMEVAR